MIEVFGETLGCTMFRKVGPWYAKRFGPCSLFNKGIVRILTKADYEALLAQYIAWRAQFLDDAGQLLPKFAPRPHALNFRDETDVDGDAPAVTRREAIPVPVGPNELW